MGIARTEGGDRVHLTDPVSPVDASWTRERSGRGRIEEKLNDGRSAAQLQEGYRKTAEAFHFALRAPERLL